MKLMFTVYCSRHRARILLSGDEIEGVFNGPGGIDVQWRCTCGEWGVWQVGPPPGPPGRSGHGARQAGPVMMPAGTVRS